MSLHLGNLSSRIRRDDLELVFRRFGRCTIQVKDKYGFVVYDYPASAEKALKTLGGKRICGEAITLSWSKMQPRAPHGLARGGKAYQPPSRKQSMKEHVDRRLGSNNKRDYEMDSKQPDGEGRKLGSSDLIDESKAYVGERDHTAANGRGRDGKNHLEDDRWGEQVVNPSSKNLEFDRYEPYHSDDKESDMRQVSDREPLSSQKRKEFRDKKRNRRDYKIEDKNHAKRARAALSSSFHSDYTSSRSQSPSRLLESLSQAPSHSKSLHLKNISPSSCSRHSEHKPCKSMSASRSMSPTFFPSPSKGQTDSKVSMVNAVGLAHSQDLLEKETMVRTGMGPAISENVAAAMENECEAILAKLEEEDMKKDDEHCHSVSRGSGGVLKSNVPQLDDSDNTADTLSHQSVKEMRDSQRVDLLGEHILAPESDVSLISNASNPAKMSLEEICMVLKHYGLQYPEETEKDLPVEIYFGSARSWPWEIIYYRRLKKGPISAENYARRIAQNNEFGIVDKYIRGSSGWGDLNEGNP